MNKTQWVKRFLGEKSSYVNCSYGIEKIECLPTLPTNTALPTNNKYFGPRSV